MHFLLLALCVMLAACGSNPIRKQNASSARFAQADGAQCKPLTNSQRELILRLAAPENFRKTRYKKGPRYGRNIEREADCSTFVHEIYRRAGFPFAFQSTHGLRSAPEFVEIAEEEAAPGDLMVFRGHVGIIAEDGKIISATRNRKGRKLASSSSIKKYDRHVFRGQRTALRYHCASNETQLAQNP